MSMDDRQRRREGSLRAQAARARRVQTRKRRQTRKVAYIVGGVALAVAVTLAAFLVFRDTGPGIGFAMSELPGRHGPPYIYRTDITVDDVASRVPPTSGSHTVQRSSYGFLGGPLVAESVVHNMEHGAAVIWYRPGDPDLAGAVNQLVRQLGPQCLIAGSFSQMSFAVVATVWGRVLPLEQFDSTELLTFLQKYRGRRGPEAGICRQES